MLSGEQAAISAGLRQVFAGRTVAGMGSGDLVRRFAAAGDEAAFEALVLRHGPMVLGVCRRTLRDPHDVDDAFQATFLVLARRAGAIRDGDLIGPWLFGVAQRVSRRARDEAARRRAVERTGVEVDPPAPEPPTAGADLLEIRAVIDQEIARLPDRLRGPVLLCDLEGRTQPEAAGELGLTEGAVRGRLAKARALLRSRLLRRGVVAPSAVIASATAPEAATAAAISKLARVVAASAVAFARARSPEGISAAVLALVGSVSGGFTVSKFQMLVAGVLLGALSAGGGGAAVLAWKARAKAEPAPVVAQAPPLVQSADVPPPPQLAQIEIMPPPLGDRTEKAADKDLQPADLDDPFDAPNPADGPLIKNEWSLPPDPDPQPVHRFAPGDTFYIAVLEALPGRPIEGERVVRPDGTITLGFYGDLPVAGLTRTEVKARLINHLLKWIPEMKLGLRHFDEKQRMYAEVHPGRSTRVFIDDTTCSVERPKIAVPRALRPGGQFAPGDPIFIDVLQALPGRPISSNSLIRPDGTVALGFYGDVAVAGLTPVEAKVKVIEHLRMQITDSALGLVETTADGKKVDVPPIRSTRVTVQDGDFPDHADFLKRIDDLERRLQKMNERLEAVAKGAK
jgi:RNA polymerase sigma factor (sigma-70 family)